MTNMSPKEEESNRKKLQFEAAWAVTNIASGEREYTFRLCQMNAIGAFIRLLKTTKEAETADQCIWGLGNIAGDCPELRDQVLKVSSFSLSPLFLSFCFVLKGGGSHGMFVVWPPLFCPLPTFFGCLVPNRPKS